MPARLVSRRAAPLTPMDGRYDAQRGRSARTRTTPATTAIRPPATHGQASCDAASDGWEGSLADPPVGGDEGDGDDGDEGDGDGASAAIARRTPAGSPVARSGALIPSDDR